MIDPILSFNSHWAYVLNQISNRLPSNAWLDRIKFQATQPNSWEFVVEGMALPLDTTPSIKLIGKYVGDLKNDMVSSIEFDEDLLPAGAEKEKGDYEVIGVETSTNQKIIGISLGYSFYCSRYYII